MSEQNPQAPIEEVDVFVGNENAARKVCQSLDEIDKILAEDSVDAKAACDFCGHPRNKHGDYHGCPEEGCNCSTSTGGCPCKQFVEPNVNANA